MVFVWIIDELIDFGEYLMSQMKPVGQKAACDYTLGNRKTPPEKKTCSVQMAAINLCIYLFVESTVIQM